MGHTAEAQRTCPDICRRPFARYKDRSWSEAQANTVVGTAWMANLILEVELLA